jgi:hypothetical protein
VADGDPFSVYVVEWKIATVPDAKIAKESKLVKPEINIWIREKGATN